MPDGTQLSRPASAALVTWPNVITFGRLCAVPLAFWLVLEHRMTLAFFLFVAAGASDAVDGWLARRNGGGNAIGAVLDPVADKALLVTMYVTLASVNELPDWLAILVVFRDLVIVGGVLVLAVLGDPVTIRPLYVSKLNTAVTIDPGFDDPGAGRVRPSPHPAKLVLIWAVAATTLTSGAAYVWVTVRGR